MLAASDDANPNGTWFFRFFNANLTGFSGNNFAADIGLASDEEAVYVTTSHYLFSNGVYQDARVTILNKAQWFANAATAILTRPEARTGRRLVPSSPAGPGVWHPAGGATGTFFVTYSGVSGDDSIRVVSISNPLAATPTFTRPRSPSPTSIGRRAYRRAQSGSATPIDTGDREVGNAVWQNNLLYFASTINPVAGPDANQATAHYFVVDTTNNSLADQGNISGTVNLHTFFPTVTVDIEGSLAVAYTGSEGGDFVKTYYAARRFDDPLGTMRDQVKIDPAPTPTSTYVNLDGTTNVWGPSTSIARDPVGRGFYAFGAFATTPATGTGNNLGRWATKGVGFSFNWAPEVVPGGVPTLNVDEDSAPVEIDLDPAFNDYEDLVVSTPAVPLNFELVDNSDPTRVNVVKTARDKFQLTFPANANGSVVLLFQATDSGGRPAPSH